LHNSCITARTRARATPEGRVRSAMGWTDACYVRGPLQACKRPQGCLEAVGCVGVEDPAPGEHSAGAYLRRRHATPGVSRPRMALETDSCANSCASSWRTTTMARLRGHPAPRWTAVFLLWAALCCLFVPAGMCSCDMRALELSGSSACRSASPNRIDSLGEA
jgi:hypothetical protein